VAGCSAKVIKVPVYKNVDAQEDGDVAGLSRERQKLNAGNVLQATLNFAAAALMTGAFIRRLQRGLADGRKETHLYLVWGSQQDA